MQGVPSSLGIVVVNYSSSIFIFSGIHGFGIYKFASGTFDLVLTLTVLGSFLIYWLRDSCTLVLHLLFQGSYSTFILPALCLNLV